MNKLCNTCKIEKEINLFPKGRRVCRSCCNEECRQYKLVHKQSISEYNKRYKLDHIVQIKDYNKNYNLENRISIQKRHTSYLRNKRKTDPQYKMSCLIRNRIKALLHGKENRKSTRYNLGCDYDFLKSWLESQFIEGMTFENHGSLWHIDHVIPCSHFDLTNDTEILKCFNWSNTQPLIGVVNMSKKNKIDINEVNSHSVKVLQYIQQHNMQENNNMFTKYKDGFLNKNS
jgi:hypothetical protein